MSMPKNRAVDQATSVEDVDRVKRTITHKINTDAIDRYSTLIVPRGMRCKNFRANPTVYWNHDARKLPIGRNVDLKPYDRKIIARTQFTPQGINPEADTIFDMYELGFLNAWSVSFDPIEFSVPTPDEIRKRPELASCRCVYRAWDLLEYSCVTIPGNQDVTRAAVARGFKLPGWSIDEPEPAPVSRETAPALPPLVGRSYAQVQDAFNRSWEADKKTLREQIRRDALDLAKGKV